MSILERMQRFNDEVKNSDQPFHRKLKRFALITNLLWIPIIFVMWHDHENEEAAKQVAQQKIAAQAELDKILAAAAKAKEESDQAKQQQLEDEDAAQRMGLSFKTYKLAQETAPRAFYDCRKLIEASARWGSRGASWLSNIEPVREWVSDGKSVQVTANDLRLKNGFNAEEQVTYTCSYNLATERTTILSVE